MGITLDIYKENARKKTYVYSGECYMGDYYICDINSRTAWMLVGYLHHVQKIDTSQCVINEKIKVSVLLDFAKRVDSISMFDGKSEIENKMGFPNGYYSSYDPNELIENFMYAKYEISEKFTPILSEESVIIDAGW